jgi:hypothetical protein
LDARNAERLAPLMLGALFSQGRHTVASWLRAVGVGRDFRKYYYFLTSLGRRARRLSTMVLILLLRRLPLPQDRLLLAIDDTPTKRFGPCVEGAGVHRNPTPGPAGSDFLYGHVWVTLAWVLRHPLWGTIGLPLSAELYVRAQDVKTLVPWYQWKFRTKLQQAADLVRWAAELMKSCGRAVWVVADGAYAKRPFLKEVSAAGVTVVSRLAKNAALWSVPEPLKPGERRGKGRPRKYGKQKFSLAKRAGHEQGWQTAEFELYGKMQTKTFKLFPATYRPAGGAVQVVLVREDDGWKAWFCTDLKATAEQMLTAVADRSAIEQDFHDLKEVHGAGEQQLRNIWANIGAYHLLAWLHTLVELWAWNRPQRQIGDRSDSPWDDAARRPSHADRRNALRRACLQEEYSRAFADRRPSRKIAALLQGLVRLVA